MGWIKTVAREIWGLFVDDGSFAATIVVWLGFVLLILRRFASARVDGFILFAGLVGLLIENVVRSSRKPRV